MTGRVDRTGCSRSRASSSVPTQAPGMRRLRLSLLRASLSSFPVLLPSIGELDDVDDEHKEKMMVDGGRKSKQR